MLKSAGLFIYEESVEKVKFNKPAINVDKQIELLKSRGLIINDVEFAKNIFSNITYYRLSAYMKYFQVYDKFKTGTTFEDVINLYNFDKDLKFKPLRILDKSPIDKTSEIIQNGGKSGSEYFSK